MNGYVDVLGHPTWIDDDAGDGTPVLLLHGGFGSNDLLLGLCRSALDAARYRLVAFDRRGHGKTADADAPFHYETMADETLAILRDYIGGPAHLVGYSDGGNVALLAARREPALVESLTLISANFHHDGLHPEGASEFVPGDGTYELMQVLYGGLSPDGAEHFPVVAGKGNAMIATEPTLTTDDLRTIDVPTLVMAGDDDLVDHHHTVELFESLPDARLAIVPGASHLLVVEKPAAVGALIAEFLADTSPPTTLMPLRRA